MSAPRSGEGPRVVGVDLARGIASVLMIQGHAFDAWASESARRAPAFAIERDFLQTLALPSFLVLAGASVALRALAAERRAEPARELRASLVQRGLRIVAVGYGLNAFSAIVDGWEGLETWLRADVLQVIGLSLAALGLLGNAGAGTGAARSARFAAAAWSLSIVPLLACVPLTLVSRGTPMPLGYFVGLFAEVPGVTRMPFVPLASWAGIGVLLGLFLARANQARRAPGGAPRRVLAWLLGLSIAAAFAFTWLQGAIVAALGGPLDRAHWAVIPNALQLAARGAGVLAFGGLLASVLPASVQQWLVRLGRGSLWAYAFHVPLCYGRLGQPLQGTLDLAECALAAAALVITSWCVVWSRDEIVRRRALRKA